MVSVLCSSLSTQTSLRDLELSLESPSDVVSVLDSLSSNYMVKTVRLASLSKEKFSEEDEEKGKEFKRKRVGTEVVFSRGDAKFKKN